MREIAALYVEKNGAYYGLEGVDPWDEARDARRYAGPHPVVAHPPCQRWGRYWHGSPRKPHQYEKGADGGTFAAALSSLRQYGGVLEHPAYSHAWQWFGLPKPTHKGGWITAGNLSACHVEQGHYGHMARKATWLLAAGVKLPELRWGPSPQRICPIALERHGYEKARRAGVMSYIGGKAKSDIRAATPPEFRDLLISLARSVET